MEWKTQSRLERERKRINLGKEKEMEFCII